MKWICSAFVLVILGLSAFADDKVIPDGWKESTLTKKMLPYTITTIPDQKTGKTRQSDRSSTRQGVTIKASILSIDGPTLSASMTSLTSSALPKDSTPASRLQTAKDILAKTLGGELTDEMKIKLNDKWDGLEFPAQG